MSPVQSNVKPTNDHNYPALDYPVGIGTGLVAVKSGMIKDMPGVPTRHIYSGLRNGQAWPNAGGGSPNSGNVISIDHGNGEWTCYLHVSPFDVNIYRGLTVNQGSVFHRSGNNGWSTGPHLHFEVWKDGQRIDPGPWLANIKQGGDMPSVVNIERVNELFVAFWRRDQIEAEASKAGKTVDQWLNGWVGTESNTLVKTLAESPQYRNKRLDAENEVAVLKQQLKDCQAGDSGVVLAPGTYKVK
jgi:hypothetical protein